MNEGKDPDMEEKKQQRAHIDKRKAIRKEQKRKNKQRKMRETEQPVSLNS